jgi:protein tyrosine phosphatase (PTP) superfamily phosphohydrolase (DUF442 family)
MKRLALACLFTVALAAPALAAHPYSCPIAGDAMVVYRLAWVDPGRYLRSGAVVVGGDHLAEASPADAASVAGAYRMLKSKYRVGAVVNLRAESSEDAAAARQAGMTYLYLPIADGQPPTSAQTTRFFKFLSDSKRDGRVVLWHCAGGIGRTGIFAAMLRLREGWSTREAAEEMFAMGLNYAQAEYHLPALNAFATALGKPTWYPPNWPYARTTTADYRPTIKTLPAL